MIVTLDEMKQYLRVDTQDDDTVIGQLMESAVRLCMDILRTDDENVLLADANGKIGVYYTTAYLYEHREEADHHALAMTLRALFFGSRQEGF